MILYDYFRSSAAFRVRIALNLKNISAEHRFVHLAKNEQCQPEYRALNPQGLVPMLVDSAFYLTQSLAIIEYLNDLYPEPPLLPADPAERAFARSIAQLVACDMHPLNNKRVLDYLTSELQVSEIQKNQWYAHWIQEGFAAIESLLAARNLKGAFCAGDQPGMADVCLIPQVFNARRFNCPLEDFPRLMQVYRYCMQLPAFDNAQPSKQPDAE